MDPNWFYSTLAQSTAGIVGLLGALLATHLQRQLREARLARGQMAARHREWLEMRRIGADRLVQYIAWAPGYIEELRTALASPDRTIGLRERLTISGRMPADPQSRLSVSEVDIDREEVKLRDAQAIREVIEEPREIRSISQAVDLLMLLFNRTSGVHDPEISDVLFRHAEALNLLLAADMALRESTSLRTPGILLGVLTWFCIVGLVIPLLFLSASPGPSKEQLIWAFAAGLVVLVGYIGFQVEELRRVRRRDGFLLGAALEH